MSQITFRLASAEDTDRVLELLHGEAGEEALALMGSRELAIRYDEALFLLDPIPNNYRTTVLAEDGERAVGMVRYQLGGASHHSRGDVIRLLLRLLGPVGVARRVPALWARTKVDVPVPDDALHIASLAIDETVRGRGLGTQLVELCEVEAARLGARRLSVVTLPTDARRLHFYERLGFRLTKTVTNARYEKRTGIPGRVYLEKVLTAAPTDKRSA